MAIPPLDLFSSGPAQSAAGKAAAIERQGTKLGYNQATDLTKKYGKKAVGAEQQALVPWQTIFGQGSALSPVAMSALGVGDPSIGRNAWENSIPYQMFQGLVPGIQEAALRRGGGTGQTGQIPIDMNNRLLQALNPFYSSWQSSLEKGYGLETNAAQGEASVYGKLADLFSGQGDTMANLALKKQLSLAGIDANAVQQKFQANVQAGMNQLDAIKAAISAATAVAGGAMGGGTAGGGAAASFGQGLSKLFSGTGSGGSGEFYNLTPEEMASVNAAL